MPIILLLFGVLFKAVSLPSLLLHTFGGTHYDYLQPFGGQNVNQQPSQQEADNNSSLNNVASGRDHGLGRIDNPTLKRTLESSHDGDDTALRPGQRQRTRKKLNKITNDHISGDHINGLKSFQRLKSNANQLDISISVTFITSAVGTRSYPLHTYEKVIEAAENNLHQLEEILGKGKLFPDSRNFSSMLSGAGAKAPESIPKLIKALTDNKDTLLSLIGKDALFPNSHELFSSLQSSGDKATYKLIQLLSSTRVK